MILSELDAAYAADKFINYFSNTGRIDEYLRNVKLDRIAEQPNDLSAFMEGAATEDDLFSRFDKHPADMRIKIYPAGEYGGLTNVCQRREHRKGYWVHKVRFSHH